MNTPFGNSITTAEHAIAMMFAVARQLPEADASTHAGKWEKSKFMGVEITGKTLGVIGAGNIGSASSARSAIGLGCMCSPMIRSCRRSARGDGRDQGGAGRASRRADFITLHVPLDRQDPQYPFGEALAKTKPGVRIINCARGGLVDEAALAER
jgi:D-3-phosphoglycerate dehydrogenase